MFSRIEIFDKRYNELNKKIYEPSIAANVEEYQKIMKEIREIEPLVEKYREYKQAKQTIEDSLEILNDSSADGGFEALSILRC